MLKINVIRGLLPYIRSKMKICVVLPLDIKSTKHINQYRFKYDKELQKNFEPVIEITPPVEDFVNIKFVKEELSQVLNSFNRIKIQMHKIGSLLPDEAHLYFEVEREKQLMTLRRKVTEMSLFAEHHGEEFSPHIPFYSTYDYEEAETIYEDVEEDKFRHDFFANQVYLIVNDKDNGWEIMAEYDL